MEERLRNHVDSLFENAPKTQKAFELKEEIFTNLKDKYNDLIDKGAKPEEAYEIIIQSIGDVDELISGLKDPGTVNRDEEIRQNAKKSAKLVALSTALYILSPVFIIGLAALRQPILGLVLMLCCVAIATAIVVYNNNVYRKPEKLDDTMVEEFKTWQAENKVKEKKKEAYSSIVWPIIVALYFILSFLTGAWHITWVLFIVGAAAQQIIKLAVDK